MSVAAAMEGGWVGQSHFEGSQDEIAGLVWFFKRPKWKRDRRTLLAAHFSLFQDDRRFMSRSIEDAAAYISIPTP